MKIAVVGLGYWGPQLVRNLDALQDCSEIMVCDLDPDRVEAMVRRYPSATGTTDYGEVLQDDSVSGVVLATPVATHVELARQVVEAGKSVLVEKPLATSRAQAQQLVDLATEHGVLLMAGHTFLYSPAVRLMKDLIDSDKFGVPLYLQSSRVNLGLHQSDVSVVWDLAPHDLSILMHWLGEKPVRISTSGRASHGIGPADVAFVDLAFPSGCIANLHLSWLAPTKIRRITLVGSRRMAIYEDTNYEEPIKVYDKGVKLPDPEDFGQFKAIYRAGDVHSPRVPSFEPLRAELEDFLRRILAGEVPDAREDFAVAVVAAAEAAERSFREGGRVVEL